MGEITVSQRVERFRDSVLVARNVGLGTGNADVWRIKNRKLRSNDQKNRKLKGLGFRLSTFDFQLFDRFSHFIVASPTRLSHASLSEET